MVTDINASTDWRPLALAAPPADRGAADGTAAEQKPAGDGEFRFFGEDGFTFLDFLDIINPLQHIPVVSSIYRSITGDTLDPGPRIAGSTLFFGPLGAASSVVNTFVEYETGKDIGGHAMALLNDETPEPAAGPDDGTEVAEFSTAAGWTPAADDPVSNWARRELDWARDQAAMRTAPGGDSPDLAAVELPDATALLSTPGASAALETPPGPRGARTGAIGDRGGWFSDVMLSGLSKYQTAAALDEPEVPAALDVVN